MDYARKIAFNPQLSKKNKVIKLLIDRFGDKNQLNSNNFNATFLKFS